MECVSRDQLGPASSFLALSLLVLLVLVCERVCTVLYACVLEEMVTPANNSDEMAEVGVHAAELFAFVQFLKRFS